MRYLTFLAAVLLITAATAVRAEPPATVVISPESSNVEFEVGMPSIDPRLDRVCIYAETDLDNPVVCGSDSVPGGPDDHGMAQVFHLPATLTPGEDQFFRAVAIAIVDGVEIRSPASSNRGLFPQPVPTPAVLP